MLLKASMLPSETRASAMMMLVLAQNGVRGDGHGGDAAHAREEEGMEGQAAVAGDSSGLAGTGGRGEGMVYQIHARGGRDNGPWHGHGNSRGVALGSVSEDVDEMEGVGGVVDLTGDALGAVGEGEGGDEGRGAVEHDGEDHDAREHAACMGAFSELGWVVHFSTCLRQSWRHQGRGGCSLS